MPHGITEGQAAAFANELYAYLRDLAGSYERIVDEEQHIQNIRALAERLTAKGRDTLNQSQLPFGVAQKAFNSYLKYLWCVGRIELPPHCPFDGRIIRKLNLTVRCEW